MTPADLSRLLAEATEGPWRAQKGNWPSAPWIVVEAKGTRRDAALIVALRNHGDALAELWQAVEDLREAHEDSVEAWPLFEILDRMHEVAA